MPSWMPAAGPMPDLLEAAETSETARSRCGTALCPTAPERSLPGDRTGPVDVVGVPLGHDRGVDGIDQRRVLLGGLPDDHDQTIPARPDASPERDGHDVGWAGLAQPTWRRVRPSRPRMSALAPPPR